MFKFMKNIATKGTQSSKAPSKRKTQLQVEALEERALMATLSLPPIQPPITVPDAAGSTIATARPVNLAVMQQATVSDYLPSAADVDMYRIYLNAGDFLVADVNQTGTSPLQSSLAILNANGTAQQTVPAPTLPGNISHGNVDPAVGFWAKDPGYYFAKVGTTATSYTGQRKYDLDLHRIGLNTAQEASDLQQGGAFHVWQQPGPTPQAPTTLFVTGPTGYGFGLRGTWNKTPADGGKVSYKTTGALSMMTAGVNGSQIELPMSVPTGGFTVVASDPGWDELGLLSSVSGNVGLSLDNYAGAIEQALGVDVSGVDIMAKWTIKTGSQVKSQFAQHDIGQVLDGAPYLTYGDTGRIVAKFGNVNITTGDSSSLVLIANPADPFLYVGYGNLAIAGSLHGMIPFNNTIRAPGDRGINEYFGHAFASADFQLPGLPLMAHGDITVDLDANNNGQLLGGSGNAHQLFKGQLSTLENVVNDIHLGVNGSVSVGYKVGNYGVAVDLGTASVFFNGPQQVLTFKGQQGTQLNPWENTVLKDFQVGPGAAIEGYAYRSGAFSVATTSSFAVFGMTADVTITVSNTAIGVEGTLDTPIGTAKVGGSINVTTGNFTWGGQLTVDIHGNMFGCKFDIDGDVGYTLTRTGSQMSYEVGLNCAASFSIAGVAKVEGTISGNLILTVDANGNTAYADGGLSITGAFYVANPLGGWYKPPGGSLTASVRIDGKSLMFTMGGVHFSAQLP